MEREIKGDKMNRLVICRGIPGSGKSTYAKKYFESYTHVEADMFWEKDDEYKFDITKLWLAHKWCLDKVEKCLANGENVVVANTFTTPKEMKPYLALKEKLNIRVTVIRMETQYGSIHNVPEETIEKMRKRFTDHDGEVIIDE